MKIVITGARGFVGQNVKMFLERSTLDANVIGLSHSDDELTVQRALEHVDVVIHTAGVNRPDQDDEFISGNVHYAESIFKRATESSSCKRFILLSSAQATQDNEYGKSKLLAEDCLKDLAISKDVSLDIYRLPGVFGKWSRPNYNSVVSTFCHNISRGISIQIRDASYALNIVYIDDVVRQFYALIQEKYEAGTHYREVDPIHSISLGSLADLLQMFKSSRETLEIARFNDPLIKKLYTTYLSYLPKDSFNYKLLERKDNRGKLAELIKGEQFGQIFISTTNPGITRGNHFHHLKVEKFCVMEGEAKVHFRDVRGEDHFTYDVSGEEWEVIDIPPGYLHSLENSGDSKMICLFWANEPFDMENPDTYYEPVIKE